MSSNSSGPASPFNADEAEQLAAQFRPIWDVEDTTPALEAQAGELQVMPPVPPAKVTARWAPGSGPEGFPAPAPPAPLPVPSPRKRREAPVPLEVRELTGDEKVPVSSDGAVAMAVVTRPVLPPKAADIVIPQEPSIVVKDIAATARAITEEESFRKRDEEERRRRTVRLEDLRKDPGLAEMYARYDTGAKSTSAVEATPAVEPSLPPVSAPAVKPASKPSSWQAADPLPAREVAPRPVNHHRRIVLGAVGGVVLIALLGIARATFLDKEEPLPTTLHPGETSPRPTSIHEASPGGTVTSESATPRENPTNATIRSDPPAKPTTTDLRKELPSSRKDKKDDRPREEPKAKAAPPTQAPPQVADKKPVGKLNGGIVREVPF
ncbi:MAG: hypothetical protein RMJ98_06685 [Myxococcales bacterium]|nr:hypothetical protein [Polyangiaceae bacterium]MDW8248971.1 hypothetical protein [Myxococcales bacterium]